MYDDTIICVNSYGVGKHDESQKKWFDYYNKRIIHFLSNGSRGKYGEKNFKCFSVDWGTKVQAIETKFLEDYTDYIKKTGGRIRGGLLNKITRGSRNFFIDSAGDIIMSFEGYKWEEIIRPEISKTLQIARAEAEKIRCQKGHKNWKSIAVLFGHSLGSIYLFKFCSEIGHKDRISKKYVDAHRKGLVLNTIFTCGSPCSFWKVALALEKQESFFPKFPPQPIPPQWLNEHNPRDMISAPITPWFKDLYDEGVVVDKMIRLRGFRQLPLIAHTQYAHSRLGMYYVAQRLKHILEAIEHVNGN